MSRVCLVSDKYRFIWVLMPKNASSSMRSVLNDPVYESTTCTYFKIDAGKKTDYFKFTVLRDPVSRFLSAYQEVSWRIESGILDSGGRRFVELGDDLHRINSFLDSIWGDQWDNHIRKQVDLLEAVEVDRYCSVENLQADIEQIFHRLNMGTCPHIPVRRSRADREKINKYSRFLWHPDQLDAETIGRIKLLYREDLDLIGTQANRVGKVVLKEGFDRESGGLDPPPSRG